MKTSLAFLILVLGSTLCFGQSGSIEVEIKGCENASGVVQIGLYNDEDGFPDYDKGYKGFIVKASEEPIVHLLPSIPSGTYAIAVWHDENQNNDLDKNFMGIPKEKYGFSNNVFGKFGPPDFKDASFEVESDKKTELIINLK